MQNYPLSAHLDHNWGEAGRCVYCKTCGTNLYQGTVPKDQKAKEAFAHALDSVIAKALERHP